MKLSEFREIVNKINMDLDELGKRAVQRIDKRGKDAQRKNPQQDVDGKVFFGFKPQFVYDSVNQHISFTHEIFEGYPQTIEVKTSYGESAISIVRVKVHFHGDDGNIIFSTGYQVGSSRILGGEAGDAEKGAITDGIQKAMSLVGIGSKAYRGELKTVYRGSTSSTGDIKETPPVQNTSDSPIATPTTPSIDFKNSTKTETTKVQFTPNPSFKKFSEGGK